ncbi:glycosyltransferase 1 domain-containing 1 [Labeo rohita]|uniref:Glycosyltransferase 1 domain-containing 1 n=1 Tax=Labeo rohita TaxID=84645 RepID=A0A498NLC5_LABRO|nr:glycosyltransferase 1 domain-containing 1 [Labeo rohita]
MSSLWLTTFASGKINTLFHASETLPHSKDLKVELQNVGVPFGVVFGGTDVNEDVKDEHKRAVMEEVLRKARNCFKSVRTKQVENLRVFLLVCGVRRVKDPLYLLEAFEEWHSQNPLVVLIIIGPKVYGNSKPEIRISAEVLSNS